MSKRIFCLFVITILINVFFTGVLFAEEDQPSAINTDTEPSATESETQASESDTAPTDMTKVFAAVQEKMSQEDFTGAAAVLKEALEGNPQNEELWAKLAEVKWYEAEWLPESKNEERKRIFQEGMQVGEKALSINRESIGGHYWTAANMASLGKEQGVMKSLFRLKEVASHMKVVEEKQPDYYYGAIYRYWAIVTLNIPSLGRRIAGKSMKEAYENIQKAIAAAPDFFKNKYYLALWYVEEDEYEKAKEVLVEIKRMDPDELPEMAWQNRYFIKQAEELHAEIELKHLN